MTIVGSLEVITRPEEWTERALCAQVDPEIFHVERGQSSKPAKKICSNCPVIEECLEYALRTDQRFGVFGGYSERERRKLRDGQQVKRTFEPARMVSCARCSREFRWWSAQVKYCSAVCKKAARRDALIARKISTPRICTHCGGEFTGARNPRTKYCSSTCRQKAFQARRRSA